MRDETVTTRRTEEVAMPFIVTTKRPMPIDGTPGDGSVVRAVATLEEARAILREAQNSGPDGTTIQVESLSPLMLASRCGASGELMMSCLRSDDWAPLIAAFNAKQAG